MFKKFWDKERKYLKYLRYGIIYFIFFVIAKYTSLYNTGLSPDNVLNALIVVCLIVYRLIAVTFVPAILFLWAISKFEISEKRERCGK